MRRATLLLALLLVGPATAFAPPPVTPEGLKAEAVQVDMRKIDLLTQMMPLLLTRKQIGGVLTAIEAAQKYQATVYAAEAKRVNEMEGKLAAAVKEAEEKGKYPDKALRGEIYAVTLRLSSIRGIARATILKNMDEALAKVLDAGQLKVMAGTFDPKEIDPVKPETVTDKIRRKAYILNILLDPLAYELLTKLFKIAPESK